MLDLKFYLSLFLRRLPWFLILTVAGTAAGLALAFTLSPTYQAQAQLVVESEQIPGELAAPTVRTEASEQLQIIEQRILTREKLLEMANRLNIYASRAAQDEKPLRPDQIVSDLRERIKIRTTGGKRRGRINATFINVSFTAPSSALAARVANEVVTLMLEENVRMRTGVSGQTLEFFEQEVTRLDAELARRGAEIVAFQEENREALPDSLEFRRGQLAAAQERLLQQTREEAAIADRRAGLVQLYEATGTVGVPVQQAQALMTPTERKLRELEGRLASSGAVLAYDNPRIRVLRAQIEALREQVAEEAAAAAGVPTVDQPGEGLPSLYEMQLADLDNRLDFIASQRAEIETTMEDLRVTIEATPANAVALDTLQRDYAAVRAQYDQAIANRARAETGDIIEALSKGERISVIEQAVPPAEPKSPNRPRLAMAGLGGGMLLGLGLIVLLEFLNTAIRRPQDIIQKMEITPIGTLPYIRTRADHIRKWLLLLFVLTLVAGSIFGVMWGINTYVMPIDLFFETMLERLPEFDLNR